MTERKIIHVDMDAVYYGLREFRSSSTVKKETIHMTLYQEAVLNVVRSVPVGWVVSYGQVAAYVGTPRAARQAGWAMRSLSGTPDFPWWRVLNNAGRISLQEGWDATPQIQQKHLEYEGVEFTSELKLDIERYRYRADKETLLSFKLDPEYVDTVLSKYDMGGLTTNIRLF